MLYHLKETKGVFDIVEKCTDTVINLSMSEIRAKELCIKMNHGSGFDGWTPSFFADFKVLLTNEVA